MWEGSKRRRHAHCCNEQCASLVVNGQLQLQELWIREFAAIRPITRLHTANGGITERESVDGPVQFGDLMFETTS